MATPRQSSGDEEDEDAEVKILEKQISELRTAKKEIFERTRTADIELERIAQSERECVDKVHRIRAEKHDRERQAKAVTRLIEVESELKLVKCENAKLKQSSKEQLQKIAELESSLTAAQRESHAAKVPAQVRSELQYHNTVTELQQELRETRQRLSDVQERLTVAEQVTAATQQRELQESGISEQLQRELTPQNLPTIQTGFRQNLCLIKCRIFTAISHHYTVNKS